NNLLAGGAGNDTYEVGTDVNEGDDTIDESGGGTDTLDFSHSFSFDFVSIDLSNPAKQGGSFDLSLTLLSGNTIENVIGSNGGLDTFFGQDIIKGNALDNVFTIGASNAQVTGGAGNDTYVLNTDANLGSVTINESGGGVDTLDFSRTTTVGVNV